MGLKNFRIIIELFQHKLQLTIILIIMIPYIKHKRKFSSHILDKTRSLEDMEQTHESRDLYLPIQAKLKP